MTDGILDLLSAILVLGIVVAIAFGFIMPLTNDDVMQNYAKLEDKAMVGEVEKYDRPDTYKKLERRKYSYDELILLMSVQDNRMGGPKGVNIRNLMTTRKAFDWKAGGTEVISFNTLGNPEDKILQGIKFYGENGMDLVMLDYDASKDNVGIIRFTEDFPLRVDEFCRFLATDTNYSYTNANNPIFYIDYQYALPDNNVYNSVDRNFDEEPIYMIDIDGKWPGGDVSNFDVLMGGRDNFEKNGYGTKEEYDDRKSKKLIDTGIIRDYYYRDVSKKMN